MVRKKKNSKAKGNTFENKVATRIREVLIPYPEVDSTVAYNLVHRTGLSGGRTERGDIIIRPPALAFFPWFIECRNRQSWSWSQLHRDILNSVIVTWYFEDAVDKCHPYGGMVDRSPLLIFTKNYHPEYFLAAQADVKEHTNLHPKNMSWVLAFYKDDKRYIIGLLDDLLSGVTAPNEELYNDLDFSQ